MICVQIEDDLVVAATAQPVCPPGWLVVVPAVDTRIKQPPIQIPDGDGGQFIVPQPDVIVPFSAAPGTVGTTLSPDVLSLSRCMVGPTGLLEARPVSPVPYVDAGQIKVPPCVAGTEITVSDLTGEELMTVIIAETDDFEETIGFAESGLYSVEVQAPAPALPSVVRIEI